MTIKYFSEIFCLRMQVQENHVKIDLLAFFAGNVVTIKLSENQESVLQNDGTYLTMIVEIHFQMNYSSGEWKRIKKYRRLED